VSLIREEFLHALRRAGNHDQARNPTRLKLAFGKNNLAITANSPEVGEARESLAINYKGKEWPSPSIRKVPHRPAQFAGKR